MIVLKVSEEQNSDTDDGGNELSEGHSTSELTMPDTDQLFEQLQHNLAGLFLSERAIQEIVEQLDQLFQ